MSKIKGAIVVDTERCKGCQLCIVACPKDVIQLAQKKVNVHGYPSGQTMAHEAQPIHLSAKTGSAYG